MSHHHKQCSCHDHESCCCSHCCCHHHGHHHHCCCGTSEDSCRHCKESEGSHEDFSHQLIHLADQAWMDLLMEKIKQEVSSLCGEQLDHIAKLVAERNQTRWKHKMSITKTQKEFKDKLDEIFYCPSGTCAPKK